MNEQEQEQGMAQGQGPELKQDLDVWWEQDVNPYLPSLVIQGLVVPKWFVSTLGFVSVNDEFTRKELYLCQRGLERNSLSNILASLPGIGIVYSWFMADVIIIGICKGQRPDLWLQNHVDEIKELNLRWRNTRHELNPIRMTKFKPLPRSVIVDARAWWMQQLELDQSSCYDLNRTKEERE